MQKTRFARPILGALLVAALGGYAKKDLATDPQPQAPVQAQPQPRLTATTTAVGAASIAGLNWADSRGNFTDDALVLSGLAAGDSYATVQSKSDAIISGFLAKTGANAVRLPSNPPTATGSAWVAYQGAIDKALSKGLKVIIGEGYAQNITNLGPDARFSSCLRSIHLYDFFYGSPTTTAASWETAFAANLGSYGSRAVLTEWGAFMTTGANYNSAIADDVQKSYVLGMTNYCRENAIASVYWPGLRTGDQYRLLQFDGTSTTVSNASGLGRVQFA